MNNILALASLALAALAVYLSRSKDPAPPPERNGFLATLGFTVLLFVVSALAAPRDQTLAIIGALAIGAAAAMFAAGMRVGGLGGFAVGVLTAALGAYVPSAQYAILASLGLGALLLASDSAVYASLGVAAAMAGNALGPSAGDAPNLAVVGTIVTLGAVVAGLLTSALPSKAAGWLRPVLTSVLAAVLITLTVGGYLKLAEDQLVVLAAALAALVVHWLLAETEDSLRVGVSAVVWLGLGIVVFGLGRGVGMAIAFATAAAILASLQSRAALLTIAPLGGLVLYRVLRDAQTVAPPALEATQYNALIGLVIGMLLPLLPTDWLHLDLAPTKRITGLALWAVLLVAAPVSALIVTGPRGVVGLVIGLGISGLLVALKGIRTLTSLGVAIGLAGAVMVSYEWFRHLLVIERDEKIRLLAVLALVFVALGGGLAAVTPRPVRSEEATR